MKTLIDLMTKGKRIPKTVDLVPLLYKYLGAQCTINQGTNIWFKPMVLDTHVVNAVQAGSGIKLFLRPAEDLGTTTDMADALHKAFQEAKHLESPMKEVTVYAGVADTLRSKQYDIDLLFEYGYALHLDLVNIF